MNIKKSFNNNNFVISVLICIYVLLFSYLSFSQHDGLKTQMNDLGNIDQPLFETTKGKFMRSTNYIISDNAEINRFGIHANFTLLFFVPIYSLFPNPKILLFSQTFIIAMGALPLYWIGKKLFVKRERLSLVVPIAYLINPMVHDVNLYDFHLATVAMPLIIFVFYFLYFKKYFWFYIFSIFLALSNEDMPLLIFMFALFMIFVKKERSRGLVLALFSLIYFFLVTEIVMPYFAEGANLAIISQRYSYLGNGVFGIIKNLLTNPGLLIINVFTADKIAYLATLLLPVFFIPLFSPQILVLAMPSILINLLSKNPMTYYPFQYYHMAPILAFIFLASVPSLYKLVNLKNIFAKNSAVIFLISAIITSYFLSPAPYSLVSSWKEFKRSRHPESVYAAYKYMSQNASLSVQNNLGAHFSQRDFVYTYPFNANEADYVLIDVYDPYLIPRYFPRNRSFEFATQMSLETYNDKVKEQFNNLNYGIVYYSGDGTFLFKRNADNKLNNQAFLIFENLMGGIKSKYGK